MAVDPRRRAVRGGSRRGSERGTQVRRGTPHPAPAVRRDDGLARLPQGGRVKEGRQVNGRPDPWDAWMTWVAEHPRTILYLVIVTTLNLIVNLIEVLT